MSNAKYPIQVAVDLDGTLAEYHGWKGIDHIGKPVPAMLKRVNDFIESGVKVTIFTARASDSDSVYHVREWLKTHGLGSLEITNIKRKEFVEFWDDRAISVEKNTGCFKNANEIKPPVKPSESIVKADQGSHYRYEYKGVKLDPARICMVYKQGDPLLCAIVKKSLAAGNRGHKDFKQDLLDIICAAERRLEMLEEDSL